MRKTSNKIEKPVVAPKATRKRVAKKCETNESASKTVAKKAPSICGGLTKIIVKFDAGWGNNLYIRGNGAGLNWQKGVLMQCIDTCEWIWENKVAKGVVDFKVLINDEIWAIGDDCKVSAGDTITIYPTFGD